MIQTYLFDSDLRTFIEQQAVDSLYYSEAWLDVITKIYGYSLIPLTTRNTDGRITGFLPLCYVQSPVTGRHLVALPFSDYCPLITEDEGSANALVDQAIEIAQQKQVRYLELRTGATDVLAKRSDLVRGELYARWLTPLTTDPNVIWSSFKTTVRNKIRKSQKLGVRVRTAQCREDMVSYYRLHLRTRSKKHGMPAQPLNFFLGLWDAFAATGALHLWLAEHEGTIISASIMLAFGKTTQFFYGASDERYLHMAANNLITWETIVWSCRQGYKILDHGRTAYNNEGLMQFKRNWAAIEEPLPYYYYPHMMGLAATPESSWKYRLLTSCWRRLPLQVTGPLGSYLYRHLG